MIKSLHIKNILSHLDSHLEFDPGVNMIIGPSGHGKSAILHGFNLGAYNRPGGESIRSWDGGDILSKIKLSEGGSIALSKSKQSQYTVELPGQNPKIFKAFGSNPPEEVPALLNFHKKINVQTQFEPIFLISESPGEVAKFFNEVAGLELINKAQNTGKSDVKSTDAQLQNINAQVKDKKTELKGYDGIEKLQEKATKAIDLENKILLEESLIQDFQFDLTDIQGFQNDIQGLKQKNKIKGKVVKSLKLFDKIELDSSEIYSLEEKRDKIIDIQNQTEHLESKAEILPKIDRALVILHTGKARKIELEKLKDEKKDCLYFMDLIEVDKENNTQLQKQFDELMPKVCPLCGRGDK